MTSSTENTTRVRANEWTYSGTMSGTRERPLWENVAPLAIVYQETTKFEPYDSYYRTTKTVSETAYGDEEYSPLTTSIWTYIDGEFKTISTNTTVVAVDVKTRPGQRKTTYRIDEPIEFKTYKSPDGDVAVVAHTIYELTTDILAALVNSPSEDAVVTNLSFAPTRFTQSFVDQYLSEITFVKNRSDFTSTTTKTTSYFDDVPTTENDPTPETWKHWVTEVEKKNKCGREISRKTFRSFEQISYNYNTRNVIGFGTKTTFDLFIGFASTVSGVNRSFYYSAVPYDGIGTGPFGDFQQRTKTHTSFLTLSDEVSTFYISGPSVRYNSFYASDLTIGKTVEVPGFVDKQVFPWKTFGDGARYLYFLPNESTYILQTTHEAYHIYRRIFTVDESLSYTETATNTVRNEGYTTSLFVSEVKTGSFYKKVNGVSTTRNNATVLKAEYIPKLITNQNLVFEAQNSHSGAGYYMDHNAQHGWELFYNTDPSIPLGPGGYISPGIFGAVPLTPTFSGMITTDKDGWELCNSSEYTTVNGVRVGANFSTTVAWKTVLNSNTQTSTSSGTFSLNSALPVPVGIQDYPNVGFGGAFGMGGFHTPHASHTVFVSPGAVLVTTYDETTSGTFSVSYATGTTESAAPVGPVPVTRSSFLPLARGLGLYTQKLLDSGVYP